MIQTQRLLDRFLRYVQIPTPADPSSQSYPSSSCQLELGKLLASELQEMGAADVEHDRHGLVWATIPASVATNVPTILFNAHVDTSPEAPSANIRPQVVKDYEGGDIRLSTSQVLSLDNSPVLAELTGHTLITTDGSTLLGGDDKAGVAAIMELAQHLIENRHLPHGTVRILFTCDEEIGKGASHVDIKKAAASAAYTLDGGGQFEVENETFSADLLEVFAVGHNIHPAIAQGKMVNAVRGLTQLLAGLPHDRLSPETTSGKQGFLHPYQISGGVGEAKANILLRDFQTARLDEYAQLVQDLAHQISSQIPGLEFRTNRVKQYRNMADVLSRHPQVVDFAMLAHEKLGQTPILGSIRGGTDGAQFCAMGLPTPNLSVGQHNIHSVLEFASLNQMAYAVEHAIKLLEIWATLAIS